MASTDALLHAEYDMLECLHVPDGTVLQLVGVQVAYGSPAGTGDMLLRHAFGAAAKANLKKVAAITRCRSYNSDGEGEDLKRMKTHVDLGDPGIRFHTARGAKCCALVENYRPEDIQNAGIGVLVEYDIHSDLDKIAPLVDTNRQSATTNADTKASMSTALCEAPEQLCEALRRRCIQTADSERLNQIQGSFLGFHYLNHPHEVEYTFEEVFRRQCYLQHGAVVPDGGVVFDVGANQGLFSVFASGLATNVQVHSFEPIPAIHAVAAKNRRMYQVAGVHHNCGLADSKGEADFTFYPGLSVLSGRYADRSWDTQTFMQYDAFTHPQRSRDKQEVTAFILTAVSES